MRDDTYDDQNCGSVFKSDQKQLWLLFPYHAHAESRLNICLRCIWERVLTKSQDFPLALSMRSDTGMAEYTKGTSCGAN